MSVGRQAPSPEVTERAIRFSYAQAMLGAIFAASTGGMFLTGYALRLGADNVRIGLLSAIPMLSVVIQLISATMVERGMSRRMLTFIASAISAGGWALIVALPWITSQASPLFRVGALIALIAVLSLFAQTAGNARASWMGDLIPPGRRGVFFGRSNMFAGLIGVVFAVFEGAFLDRVKAEGISAFSLLFLFGMAFGLLTSFLFLPQADIPIVRHASGGNTFRMIRHTFSNRSLMMVTLFALVWSLQSIAGLFPTAYMLRDLQVPFLGVGLVNAVVTLTVLVASPFWGRVVDRYGCKPVLVTCSFLLFPLPLVWFFVTSRIAVYTIIGPVNLLAGFASAGISVALSTLLFKVTEGAGRSVQLAVYSIIVTLLAAPMPVLGGHLPDWLQALGINADLRITFYACVPVTLAAAFIARHLSEPGARGATELARNLPAHLWRRRSLENVMPRP